MLTPASTDAAQPGDAHQTSHTLATTADAMIVAEFGVDPRRAEGEAASCVDLMMSALMRESVTAPGELGRSLQA